MLVSTFVELLLVGAIILIAFCGCASESRERQDMVVTGMLNGQPVELAIEGSTVRATKSGPDAAQVSAMIRQGIEAGLEGVKASIPGAEAIASIVKATIGPAQPPSNPFTDPGVLTAGLGLLGLATAKTLEAREQKKDADTAWEEKQALLTEHIAALKAKLAAS